MKISYLLLITLFIATGTSFAQERTLSQTSCVILKGEAGIQGDEYWQSCDLYNTCDQPVHVKGAKVNTTFKYFKESKSKNKQAYKSLDIPDILLAPNSSYKEKKSQISNDNRTYNGVVGQEGVTGTIVEYDNQTPASPFFDLERKERVYIGLYNDVEYYLEVKKSLENENGFFEMKFKLTAENLGTSKKIGGVHPKFTVWMDGVQYPIAFDFGSTKIKRSKSKNEKVDLQMNYVPNIFVRIDDAFGLVLNPDIPAPKK